MEIKTIEYYQKYRQDFEQDFKEAFNSNEMKENVKMFNGYGALSLRVATIIWSKDCSKLAKSCRLAKRNIEEPLNLSDETKYKIISDYQKIKNKPLNKLKSFLTEIAN